MYNIFNLELVVTTCGDCFDRFLIRVYEMKVSLLLVKECVPFVGLINLGDIYCIDVNIEMIIYLFGSMIMIQNYGLAFMSVEASKGEYCVIIGCFSN